MVKKKQRKSVKTSKMKKKEKAREKRRGNNMAILFVYLWPPEIRRIRWEPISFFFLITKAPSQPKSE